MRIVAGVLGVVFVLLGGLWLLQGLDLVRIEPVLCVADCEPMVGGSVMWAIVGAVVLVAGALGLVFALRHRRADHPIGR